MSSLPHIERLLAEDSLPEAIEALRDLILKTEGANRLRREVTLLSGQYQSVQRDHRTGVSTGRDYRRALAQVRAGLLEVAHEAAPLADGSRAEIYVSYSHHERVDLVEEIVRSLRADEFDVHIDQSQLPYRSSVTGFMEELGGARCVVAVIGDRYLRSTACMNELLLVFESRVFAERLCPVLLPGTDLLTPEARLGRVAFWKNEATRLDREIATLGHAELSTQGLLKEAERVREIAARADSMLSTIADMNLSTEDLLRADDFQQLKAGIRSALARATP